MLFYFIGDLGKGVDVDKVRVVMELVCVWEL